ncbi:MAG: hypothetical protein IT545_07170 [Rhodobacteraceae bacterium]|nr:hypothetical protein [Paracoccaceae bacterium]
MGRLARVVATLLALAAAGLAASGLAGLVRAPAGAFLVERSAAAIRAAVDAALARAATPAAVALRLDALLAEEPRDWTAIVAVEEVAAARGLALSGDLVARRQALAARDHGWAATAAACAACLWDARACALSAILLCRLPVDLTPVGDLAGVVREGGRLALGAEADEVDLLLSGIGLAAVALVPLSGGGSAAVKLGAGLFRLARASGRLAPGVAAVLLRAARDRAGWARAASRRQAGGPALLPPPAALAPALAMAAEVGRMRAAVGVAGTLRLVARAGDAAELSRLARAAEALGPRTTGALEILGKGRLMRVTMRLADEVWATLAGLAWLVAAAAGAVGQGLAAATLRALARRLR